MPVYPNHLLRQAEEHGVGHVRLRRSTGRWGARVSLTCRDGFRIVCNFERYEYAQAWCRLHFTKFQEQ